MKKPALWFVALVVPLAAVLVFWLTLGQSERGSRSESPAPTAPPPQAAPEATAALLEEPGRPEPTRAASEGAPTEAAASAERRALEGDGSGRRIRGSVKFPAGSPADASLRVVALAEATPARQVYGAHGLLADLAAGKKREAVLGSAPVARDGSFELALGAPDDAWLLLDGRFLFSTLPRRVAAAESVVELAPELGGCLTGSVRLAPDADDSNELLTSLDLELGPEASNLSLSASGTAPLFRRSAPVDPQGRFEIRALPAGHAFSLEIQSEDFANAKLDGLQFEPGLVREVEVALHLGSTLRGSVHDAQGTPLSEVEVIAAESGMWGFPGEEQGTGTSDANGVFEILHVPAGKQLLLAKKDGFLDSEAQKLELAEGELRDGLRIELSLGASLSGSVRMPDGAVVAGASIRVNFDPGALVGMGAINAARGADGKASSGADGRFVVSGLGQGPFVVKATLEHPAEDGRKDTWLGKAAGVKPDTQGLELVLAPPSVLRGRVRAEDGGPIAQFDLRASMDSGSFMIPGESRKESIEDEEGDFVLRGLEAGKWKLAASADGFGPMKPLELVVPRLDDSVLELVLAPAASVAGSVVDPSGRAVGGARVTTHLDLAERIQRRRENDQPEATSQEDGSFLLTGLASGASSLFAALDGFAASEVSTVEASAEAPARGVVLKLRKGALVTGEVYRADGQPAAGVQIVAQGQSTFETDMKRTDGAGLFRYEHLAPGSWTITALLETGELDLEGSAAEASASMLQNMRFTMIQLEDGEEEHVVLGAPPKDPVVVRGRVRHGDRPVTQGLVSFVLEGAKGLEAFRMASLDGDGRFQTELGAPGPYLVTVQMSGEGGAFQQSNVEYRETIPEAQEHTLNFALPLGSVRGLVRGPDRSPLAATRVTLAVEGGIASGTLLGGQYSEATTDADGRYAFEYLRPGEYAVAAGGALFGGAMGAQGVAGRRLRSGLRVEEGRALEGVDFQLDEPGDIQGRVVDAAGKPVAEAAIFVRDAEGRPLDRFSMITSKGDGGFTYVGVAEGEYLVSARAKGQASPDSAPVRVQKGGTARVELVLFPGTKLEVEIVDGAGEPLRARVRVTDEHGREMQGLIGMAEIATSFGDAFDGKKQSIGPLPPGSYTVTALLDDGRKTSKPVTLDGQPERRLKLRLRSP